MLLYMMKPRASRAFRYTIRLETRPEGREEVLRQTVSGEGTEEACAVVNQVWNWVRGEGES